MKYKPSIILFVLFAFGISNCTKPSDPSPASAIEADTIQTTATSIGPYEEYKILPQSTDPLITSTSESHYAYVDRRIQLKGKLVVFLGGLNLIQSSINCFLKLQLRLGIT
jgi:hypothetical protein